MPLRSHHQIIGGYAKTETPGISHRRIVFLPKTIMETPRVDSVYRIGYSIIILFCILLITACVQPTARSNVRGSSTLVNTQTILAVIETAIIPTVTPSATPTPTQTLTSTPTQTPKPTQTFTPAPTPFGGSYEGLVAFQEEWHGDIFISSFNGEQKTTLTGDMPGWKRFISWSPDGAFIFFGVHYGKVGWPSNQIGEFWVMKPDGSSKRLLWKSTLGSLGQIRWLANEEQFLTPCPAEIDFPYNEICLVSMPDFQMQHMGNLMWLYPGVVPSPYSDAYAWSWQIEGSHRNAVYILTQDAQSPVTVPVRGDSGCEIVWLPEDQGLLYSKFNGPSTILSQISLYGELTQLKTFKFELSVIDALLDGSRILVVRVSTEGWVSRAEEYGIMDSDGNNLLWLSKYYKIFTTPDWKHVIAQKKDGSIYYIDPQTGTETQTDWMNWTAYLPPTNGDWYLQPANK